ncbi:hypothetical protein ID866_6015 [Astraeus odoratus]|nr:hypothetical protein ID866_6015 [Astraeus odoratus]
MALSSPQGLRQRKLLDSESSAENGGDDFQRHRGVADDEPEKSRPAREEVVWGKTPVFRVPTTHDVLTALFHPAYPKSHLDIINLSLLGLQLVLFYFLPLAVSRPFFLFYFVFWRAAYDAGLGWVLTKQSKRRWIVREVQRLGWLDEKRKPMMRRWIRAQLAGKMGKDYSFDDLPVEYNTWLLFRQLVDVILLNDFLAYCMFAFACFRVPEGLSLPIHILRWVGGIALIVFNLWVKTEAHNVVKDYGWYWGDCFFQRGALVFDGVFELAPHPMYSVGYAGYYGLSLIVGSYPVLFVSLTAHAAQFAFLIFFENPHIERMYGKRKPIAVRKPLFPEGTNKARQSKESSLPDTLHDDSAHEASTPAATEGETASDTDLETETEADGNATPRIQPRHGPHVSGASTPRATFSRRSSRQQLSQHDLLHKYFRRDVVILQNLDLLRSSDAMLVLLIFYLCVASCLPILSHNMTLTLHFAHACSWCIFHSLGLGLLLRAQSQSKFIVRHFLKNYHYPPHDNGDGAVQEAFANWKAIYNMSLCMTYISLGGLAWKTYTLPTTWTEGDDLLCHTLGALLIGLHAWAARDSYEVLGVFGWFYGDFFAEDFPAHLEYTGIFRYLDNPELMSGASFLGLALISRSKLVGSLAVMRFLSHWWFLRTVENPHMRKLYGESLRKEAGFTKVIKNVASKNARLLESRAGRHAPEIRRVAKEVKGTFDKVFEETADVVEEFLAKSKPRISEVVEETKVLLQQSRERLVITRVASDLSSCDIAKYKVSICPSQLGNTRFHLGEPIRVQWKAPQGHSRRDWIGIYRVGANKSTLVTKTSTFGKWLPVYDEEWDGDVPLNTSRASPKCLDPDTGTLTFQGHTLPWTIGQYEVRYHHDGKYNVLSLDGPLTVFVEKPKSLDVDGIRECLAHIVPLCLDNDTSLIPLSCGGTGPVETNADSEGVPAASAVDGRDPDDFSFWCEEQAKRISGAIKEAFNVEYSPEVVMADANLMCVQAASKSTMNYHLGAVLVKGGKIISTGHNHCRTHYDGKDVAKHGHCKPVSMHAEMHAIYSLTGMPANGDKSGALNRLDNRWKENAKPARSGIFYRDGSSRQHQADEKATWRSTGDVSRDVPGHCGVRVSSPVKNHASPRDRSWDARRRDPRAHGADLYVVRVTKTGMGAAQPCWRCMRWCAWAGVKRIFHWNPKEGRFDVVKVNGESGEFYQTQADARLFAGVVSTHRGFPGVKLKQPAGAAASTPHPRSQPPAVPPHEASPTSNVKKNKKKKGKGKEPAVPTAPNHYADAEAYDGDLYDDMPSLSEPETARTGLSPMLESVHVTATTISRSGNGMATQVQTELLASTDLRGAHADTLSNGAKRATSISQPSLPKATGANGPAMVDDEYWSSFPPHIKSFAQTMYNIAQQMVQSDTYLKNGTATATATATMATKGIPGYPPGAYPQLPFDPSIFSDPAFTLSVEQAAAAALGAASPPPGQPPRGQPMSPLNMMLPNEFGHDGGHGLGDEDVDYYSEDEVDGHFEDEDMDAFDLHPHPPARPAAGVMSSHPHNTVPGALPADAVAQVVLSYGEHGGRGGAKANLAGSESAPAVVAGDGHGPEPVSGGRGGTAVDSKGKKGKKNKEGAVRPTVAPVAAVPNAAARGETRSATTAPELLAEKDGRRPPTAETIQRHPQLSQNAAAAPMPAARKENMQPTNPPPSSRAQGKQPMAYAPATTTTTTTTTAATTTAASAATNGQQRTARAASKAPMSAHNYSHSHHHPSPPSSNASAPNKSRSTAPSGSNKNSQANNKIWSTSSTEERERIKEFWLGLGEDERRNLVKIEKDTVLKKMKEQQKHSCSCAVCGRKRHAIEEELEVLYDAYYEELERYANYQQRYVSSGGTIPPPPGPGPFPGSVELDKNARMFEQRVLQAYREKVAQERQQQLLRELEAEDQLSKEREAKKQSQNQKKKDKRKQQRLAKEEERAAKAAEKAAEEAAVKAKQLAHEEEQRKRREEERARREAARKAADEEKQRKEEERRKRVAEEREREAERERKRKEKEERARREREEKERKAREEREAKAAAEKAAREAARKEQQEKEEREKRLAKEREEKAEKERAAQQQRAAARASRQPTSPRASGSAQRSHSTNGAAKKILTKQVSTPPPIHTPTSSTSTLSSVPRSQPQRTTSTSQPNTPLVPAVQHQFPPPSTPLYPTVPNAVPPAANATPPRLPFAAAPPFGVFGPGPSIPQAPLGPSTLPRGFGSPTPFDTAFSRGLTATTSPIAAPSKPVQNPLTSPLLAPGSSRRSSIPEPGPGPVARPVSIAPITPSPISPPGPIAPPAPIARPIGETSGSGSGSPIRRSPSPKVLGSSALAADDDEVVPPPGRRLVPPGAVGQSWGNSASARHVMGEPRGPWGNPPPPGFPTRPLLGSSLWGGMSPTSEWQTAATAPFFPNSFGNHNNSSHSPHSGT